MKPEQFTAALTTGKYAWPGGYETHFLMGDGETLCFDCAKQEESRILDELELFAQGYADSEWTPLAQEVHWEGEPLQCAHCNRDIESTYGPTE